MVAKKDPLEGFLELSDFSELSEALGTVETVLSSYWGIEGVVIRLTTDKTSTIEAIYADGKWWVKFGG